VTEFDIKLFENLANESVECVLPGRNVTLVKLFGQSSGEMKLEISQRKSNFELEAAVSKL
jgi:hypothetical protein